MPICVPLLYEMVSLKINLFQESSFIKCTSFFFIFSTAIFSEHDLLTHCLLYLMSAADFVRDYCKECWWETTKKLFCFAFGILRGQIQDGNCTYLFTMVEGKCIKHVQAESRMNPRVEKNVEYRILPLEMRIDKC